MSERPAKEINFLHAYVRDLGDDTQRLGADVPAREIVAALREQAGSTDIWSIHERTGIELSQLVPALTSLQSLGLVAIGDHDRVSLTDESAILA